MDSIKQCVWGVGAFIVLLTVILLVHGFMVAVLWKWFISPMGVKAIGLPQSIGVSCLIGILTGAGNPESWPLRKMFLMWAIIFVVAWVAHFFV